MATVRTPRHWGAKLALTVERAKQGVAIMMESRRYKLFTYGGPNDGQPTQGIGDHELSYLNPYVSIYGVPEPGHKPARDLEVDESTLLCFALSGQKPTVYKLIRVR